MDTPVVQLKNFIWAIRDAGYRGTGPALAELIDNALEAGADNIDIQLIANDSGKDECSRVIISDDGCGMSSSVLETALQFGGSIRFGSRKGTGRFGMGLPNSSVSQARRVEVYTWERNGEILWSFLDVDDIANGINISIPKTMSVSLPKGIIPLCPDHGTVIIWDNCDRIPTKETDALIIKLHKEIGRIFRYSLLQKKRIRINGEFVLPSDPLFLSAGNNLVGASSYGPDLEYEISVDADSDTLKLSKVTVRFVELPIQQWHSLSNSEKRKYGISKNAGISVLRSGREIDNGWFFMGKKRKENYDDWWRGEIEFQPELDDLFGVTHTKQGINPTGKLIKLLSPDIEAIAHTLNARVRTQFIKLKSIKQSVSERIATERDSFFEPPKRVIINRNKSKTNMKKVQLAKSARSLRIAGLKYEIDASMRDTDLFFIPELKGNEIRVTINKNHPFYDRVYAPLFEKDKMNLNGIKDKIELLILSAARALLEEDGDKYSDSMKSFNESWSNLLSTFLT